MKKAATTLPLFEEHFRLAEKLSRFPIGDFPTPVDESSEMAKAVNAGRFFVKRDDLTNATYGGNKVRKLELLIGEARKRKADHLITFGGIGSNHALATTIHGAAAGMKTISCLTPQPVTPEVKKNLLTGQRYGAELCLAEKQHQLPVLALEKMAEHLIKDGRAPYVVAPGGSSVIGAIGYVNAAFELKKQIEEGVIPEPDRIFVAVGTCGTAAGLVLGCAAAGLKSKVTGVKVTDLMFGNQVSLATLATRASARLHAMDRTFPLKIFSPLDVDLEMDYFGGEYGKLTPEGTEAISMLKEYTGIQIEGVYTGKTLAALIGAGRKGDLSGQNVMFWNTYNSADISAAASEQDYRELPEVFHKFFE